MSKTLNYLKQFIRLDTAVKILELSIIWLSVRFTYVQLKDIIQGTTFPLFWIWLLLIIIGAVYTLLVFREFKEIEINLNRIIILIYLIIFCFGLFAGFVVFKNNQPLPILPKLPEGTVGLRSFGCEATFHKIEISYLDSSKVWQNIPSEVVNDSLNWIPNSFVSIGSQAPSCNYYMQKEELTINLKNSGAIFNTECPSVSMYFKGAKYFKVSTLVTFKANYKPIDNKYKYPDVQICMNVPLKREKNNKESEELYLGLSFPIENINYAKFWIPALEWMVGNQYRDSNSKLKENDFSEKIYLKKEYHLIGVSFFNSARILLRNDEKSSSSIICESKFEPD
ncbi:MAG: hypothetical protein STSR0008_24130 [Ignavibacterium sp.]